MRQIGTEFAKVRIGRIRYFNVAPVYFGFDQQPERNGISWVPGTPAELNRMMSEGAIDIGPVSSVAYAAHHNDWALLPDLSISSFGKVMSVLLVSRLPMNRLEGEKVCITDESASAAALLKLIFRRRRITPQWITDGIDTPDKLDSQTAGFLVIGDKALKNDWSREFPFVWDLGEIWRQMTGLPFVFAVWAVRKQFALAHPETVSIIGESFLQSKRRGIQALDEISQRIAQSSGLDSNYLGKYYRQLRFDLNPFQRLGLQHFFNHLVVHDLLKQTVTLSFAQSHPGNVIFLDRFDRMKHHPVSTNQPRHDNRMYRYLEAGLKKGG